MKQIVFLSVVNHGRTSEIDVSNVRARTVFKVAEYYNKKGCEVSIGRRHKKEEHRKEVKIFEYALWAGTVILSVLSIAMLVWSK